MGLFDFLKKPKIEEWVEYTDNSGTEDDDFQFVVDDVFSITGKGTVVVGTVISGAVSVGDRVIHKSKYGNSKEVVVDKIECFRKMVNRAVAGEQVGIMLKGVERKDIGQEDMLVKAKECL